VREYFEAEMRLLQESAQAFARAHPEQAGMLNLLEVKDRDPYVERLLEGMAYLTAQIRYHLENDIPEVSETLLNQLWPHFLRPFPSATIMQFQPRPGQLQQSQYIEAGEILLSGPVGPDHQACRFRTVQAVTLNPITLSRLQIEEPPGGGTLFRLNFQLDPGVDVANLDLARLRIHFHADPAVALFLHHQFTGEVRRVRVHFPDQPRTPPVTLGGREAVRPAHLDADSALIETSGRSFQGFQLLQDYFCFRDKYLFVEVHGLENVAWPRQVRSFELEVAVNGLCPQDHKISRDNFRLHCMPAVNLFPETAEPILLDHRRAEYPVVARHHLQDSVQVYSIEKVEGLDTESGERHNYTPMYAFQHRKRRGRYYHYQRRPTGAGNEAITLSVGGIDKPAEETLSCDIIASNGDLPRRYLRENDITTPADNFPSYASFHNITRPSPQRHPPARQRYQWDLISHLSLNYSSITNLEMLKRLLHLYDWTDDEQNQRRIEGIRHVTVEPVERLQRGALIRGMEIRLVVHEDHYRSQADIHLFGQVLHHFFSMYATVNSFVQTRIQCHPTNKVMSWEPLPGVRSRL